jgi:hypothetical protein
MHCKVSEIIVPNFSRKLSRPLFASRVSAGFPSPAENCVEGRIDLNRDLIKHQLSMAEAKKGFVLLPRRSRRRAVVWLGSKIRRLARDYERLPETLAGLHFLAFAILMLKRFMEIMN